jgi:hypothetical protein
VSAMTIEAAHAICTRNANGKTGSELPDGPIEWNRETMHTITSRCHTYRIVKQEDPKNAGIFGYSLTLSATATSPPKHLCGPFLLPRDARDAAERHRHGEPLQADLA